MVLYLEGCTPPSPLPDHFFKNTLFAVMVTSVFQIYVSAANLTVVVFFLTWGYAKNSISVLELHVPNWFVFLFLGG